ncbi:MAG: hypothetical protein MK052_02235 [Alphaproteobacteria bacterium]|nr:hypothetical protein [Alphaproteobacteria bacterium]
MKIAGHRGAKGALPENTLPAFHLALTTGASAVELDVRKCKSGEMVVIHDATVDRTSNGTGNVADMTLEELKELDFNRDAKRPEMEENWQDIPEEDRKISTLSEVLTSLHNRRNDSEEKQTGQNPHVFIELKCEDGINAVKDIRKAVESGDYTLDELTAIGFNHEQIREVKQQNPDIRVGLTFDKADGTESKTTATPEQMIAKALAIRAEAINPNVADITPDLVDAAHNQGLEVNTWTANTEKEISNAAKSGVDCIISDYPVSARVIARDAGAEKQNGHHR